MNSDLPLMERTNVKSVSDSTEILVPDAKSHAGHTSHSFPADLFPLPLTSFERLMLADDHQNYPRTYTVTMEFAGQLHRPAFEQAILEVIRRHPLLRAVVRKRRSKWHWILASIPDSEIRWGELDRAAERSPIDLRKTPGFRICGSTDGTTSEIRLTFHHAVCDGQGARRIILDWLTVYASIMTPYGKHTPLDPLDYDRLRYRGVFRQATPPSKKTVEPAVSQTLWQRLRTICEFLCQQPTALRPARKANHSLKQCPRVESTHRFGAREVSQFRDRLRGSRISLNDVAIALLLNTIAKWNRAHGESGADRLYRVLVPVDLRDAGDALMPAANRMSFVFITRPTGLCLDWLRLLPTIRAEMDYIEQHGSQYNLVNALPIAQSVPGAIELAVRLPVCFSTAVLTNLGDTQRRFRRRFPEEDGRPLIGNLQFVRAGGPPPLRPKTRLGIGLTISLGELVIQSQMDSRTYSPSDVVAFTRLFADNWRNWADGTPEYDSTPASGISLTESMG